MRRTNEERAEIYRAKAAKLDLAKKRLELKETNEEYVNVLAAIKALRMLNFSAAHTCLAALETLQAEIEAE